jgi:serine protease Do
MDMRRSRELAAGSLMLLLPVAGGAAPPEADAVRRTPVVAVVERVSPAVVNIAAESVQREVDPFFGSFFGGRARRTQALGSGLIIDPTGLVLTNAHVIEGASRIVVTTYAGQELEADVLGSDRDADLAVLKIAGKGLPATALGKSTDLLMGETVIAIGNPFGLDHTVTTGVLSGRGRAVAAQSGEALFTDFLQTDASINPGNSGGPLVNLAGQVIGINTAIIQGANSIGFAIPADRAQRVVDDLLRYGSLQPLWTGLRLVTVDPELARREGLAASRGAFVERVYEDSPADRAGLKDGDLLVAISGKSIAAREDVATAFYNVAPSTPLALDVRRGDAAMTVTLSAIRPPTGLGLRVLARAVGLEVELERGRIVVAQVAPRSPAESKGLEPGDVILGANGQTLADAEALGREVLRGLDRGGLLLVVQRGRYAYHLGFAL